MGASGKKPDCTGALLDEGFARSDASAWIAIGLVDEKGARSKTRDQAATVILSVNVNTLVNTNVSARLALMKRVAQRLRDRVPENAASLWAFPGGYFKVCKDSLRQAVLDGLEHGISRISQTFPRGSVVAFGVDFETEPSPTLDYSSQSAQVWSLGSPDTEVKSPLRITRGKARLDGRVVQVGVHRAAVFICGEFTGSRTESNGPFFQEEDGTAEYLDEPLRVLSDCHILVDLAHQYIPSSVYCSAGARMVHQKQMERFSHRGVAVLAHHHDGATTHGRAQSRHQSSWIVFPGEDWIADDCVVEVRNAGD